MSAAVAHFSLISVRGPFAFRIQIRHSGSMNFYNVFICMAIVHLIFSIDIELTKMLV